MRYLLRHDQLKIVEFEFAEFLYDGSIGSVLLLRSDVNSLC